MGTCFSSPEEILMAQGEYNPHIYFIINGDCAVFQTDYNRTEKVIGVLVEGNIVGEVSTIYKCCRTATVMNKNYTTLARVSYSAYREFQSDYPEIGKVIKRHISNYKDPNKRFLLKVLQRVTYL